MKQSKLSKLENQYYYGISRYFWHIIIGLSVLAVFFGILLYVWTQIPPGKKHVAKGMKPVKKEYPALKQINLNEIYNAMPVVNTQPQEQDITDQEYEPPIDYGNVPTQKVDSTAIYNFENELGTTKSLIPEEQNKAFWQGTGHRGFASERDKKMFKKTHNPKYSKWIYDTPGFKKRYLVYTKWQNINDYNDKTKLLKAINSILQNISSVNRTKIINQKLLDIHVSRLGLNKATSMYRQIGKVLRKLSEGEQIKMFQTLFNFAYNNPNDGLPLLNYESKIIDSVAYPARSLFLRRIQKEYVNYYNNNINSLTKATDHFLPYLRKISPDKQEIALKVYYELYRKNNKELNQQIQQIDNEYRNEVANWESDFRRRVEQANMEYQSKLRQKKEYRWWSYKGIAYGFVSVLIISLFLLVLSMVRNVNRLSEAMLENNKLFADQFQAPTIENKEEEIE